MRFWLFFVLVLTSQLPAQEERFLLVTGCARSGTRYTAFILRDCGLDVGHEWVFPDGLTSWLMAVDCDECPWGATPSANFRFKHVFHQVRHPLKVIASVYVNEPPESWEFICRHVPQIHATDSDLVKCAKYWYFWNLKAESKAEYTYRIENIENELLELSRRAGYDLTQANLNVVAKDTNTRRTPIELTWEVLEESIPYQLFFDIQMMALRYGYKID